MNKLPSTGNLPETSVPTILIHLNRNRKSGTLVITTPVFTKKVFLVKGDAVFASSTFEDDRLGEMLLKAGKITMEQYDKSVELLKRSGKRQGAILVELGYISPKDLFWGVKYQVKEIIYSLFLIEKAQYEFIEGEIPSREVITLKMSMGNLVYEGVKRVDNWTRIRNEMPSSDTILKLSSDPAAIYQDVELSQQDRKMLSLVDGGMSIKELIDSAWIGSFDAMKTLYVLWSIGVLEVKEKEPEAEKTLEPTETLNVEEILSPVSEDEQTFIRKVDEIYMKLDFMSPEDLLGVDHDADEETLKKHFYRLTREFHPDRYFSAADPSLKDKLDAVFHAINEAYSSLIRSKGSRPRPGSFAETVQRMEASPSVPDVPQTFGRGVDEFKKGNFQGAADLFRMSAESEPRTAKYWSYLSLALTKLPGRTDDAEKAMLEAARLEPRCADHYANLGLIYSMAGMTKKARESFDRALEIDPGNMKAKKGMDRLMGR